MNTLIEMLKEHPQVTDYKINIHKKESFELFFVKGKLETVRQTDTCDKEVTVYADHDRFKGDSQFFVYPSTTPEQLAQLINQAAATALLINNQQYTLPESETGSYQVESNFSDYTPSDLAARIAKNVFEANRIEHASLNCVEIFINKHTIQVINSRGLDKTQVKYDAMVEAIPTYNGSVQSVELYEQYNFSQFDENTLRQEIADKLAQVKARYEAITPDFPINCKVILNKEELHQLIMNIAGDLNYSTVYSHSNLFKKGDAIQKQPTGDLLGITMTGQLRGSVRSAIFDNDGVTLGSVRLVEQGKAVNYYGANRFGQYLGEAPTGSLWCVQVDPGSAEEEAFRTGPYLEIASMSGLQVDFYSDYIGGEIRLAYYYDGEKIRPVTGISISGKLSQVLDSILLSKQTDSENGYLGPKQAILQQMNIF